LVEETYQLAFSDAAIAKVHHTGFFLASNKIINTFSSFALMALVESKVTWSLSILSLWAIPSLSNNIKRKIYLRLINPKTRIFLLLSINNLTFL
jgi:hypothetical protein